MEQSSLSRREPSLSRDSPSLKRLTASSLWNVASLQWLASSLPAADVALFRAGPSLARGAASSHRAPRRKTGPSRSNFRGTMTTWRPERSFPDPLQARSPTIVALPIAGRIFSNVEKKCSLGARVRLVVVGVRECSDILLRLGERKSSSKSLDPAHQLLAERLRPHLRGASPGTRDRRQGETPAHRGVPLRSSGEWGTAMVDAEEGEVIIRCAG
jgi:hypothetical protein